MASNITTLVEKAKQGDADAFSTLYQMYYPKMKGICINILREDKAVVDDLVQDAFILALVSLKDLKNTHRFSQWLTSITTNLVLKYQEKGKRYDFISLSEIEDEFSSVLEDDNTFRQSISYEEIMSAIDSLPEGYKKIFNMSVLDGLSHQEISELLDIAPHSSSSQLSRAKAMLRNILSPRAMLIIVLALIVIPVYRYFTAKKKLVSENDVNLKSATNPFNVLLACTRPLITELSYKLRQKCQLLPTTPPYPIMRLETIRSIIPISCRRHPKSVWNTSA